MLVNVITVIYFLHVWRKSDILLVFHLFFHAFNNHMQDFSMTIFACILFVCWSIWPRPAAAGWSSSVAPAFFFPHFYANQKLFLISSSCWAPKMALGTPTLQTPSGTTASSESSVTFTYSADQGRRIMWQLCDDGRPASCRSDTRSISDFALCHVKERVVLVSQDFNQTTKPASAFLYYSVQSDLFLESAECTGCTVGRKKKNHRLRLSQRRGGD